MNSEDFEILNSFADSISVVDRNGEIVFVNQSWIKFSEENNGDAAASSCGVNYLSICRCAKGDDESYATRALFGIESVIKRDASIFEMEYPCHSEGSQRWFILRVVPVITDRFLTLITHTNVTQRKLAEIKAGQRNEQLNRINDRLNSANYKIVHDIQAPLSSIEGLLNLSKSGSNKNELGPYFLLIEKSISNLKHFIKDMLRISGAVQEEQILFNKLVLEYYDSIKYLDTLKGFDLQVNIDQKQPFYSDRAEVLSILSNVISNGIKYQDFKKSHRQLIVEVKVFDEKAVIRISDNGIGISEDQLPRIFDLKYQEQGDSSGEGVGLYLVKRSVEFIRGTIKVSSTPGVGTDFVIEVPDSRFFRR